MPGSLFEEHFLNQGLIRTVDRRNTDLGWDLLNVLRVPNWTASTMKCSMHTMIKRAFERLASQRADHQRVS
ncbi:MAG: hypothetical protein ACLVJ6_16765 [Merdibacter sp.]